MFSLEISKLMTFVLIFWCLETLAAPQEDIELDHQTTTEQETIDTKALSEEKGVIVSQPKSSKQTKTTRYYYPFRQSMAPRAGLILDPDQLNDGSLPLLLGIRYLLPSRRSPHWEVGFDIVTDEGAHITLGKRFIQNPNRFFRPYYTLSAMLSAQADEKFATVTDYENYYIKFSGGFEDVLKMPMSVRLEIELAVGLERQFAIFNFGYSWGW